MTPLIALVLLTQQDQKQEPKPQPEYVRTWTRKSHWNYKVEVSSLSDKIVRRSYDMAFAAQLKPAQSDETPVLVKLTNIETTFESNHTSQAVFGTLSLDADPTGFLSGLLFTEDTLPFSLPMLAFWLPDDKEVEGKWFPVTTSAYAPGCTFFGLGRVVKGADEVTLTLELKAKMTGEKDDDARFRRLRISSEFKPGDCQVTEASGKFTTPTGTFTFDLKRI